jgi:hypothetical protein
MPQVVNEGTVLCLNCLVSLQFIPYFLISYIICIGFSLISAIVLCYMCETGVKILASTCYISTLFGGGYIVVYTGGYECEGDQDL